MAGEVTIGKGVIPIRADTSQLTKELGSLQASVGRAINGAAGKIAAPFARAGKSVAATAKLFAGIPKTVVDSYAFTGKLAGAKLAAGFTKTAASPIGQAAIGMAAKFSVGAVRAAAKVDTAFAGVGLKIASRLSPFSQAIAVSAIGAGKIAAPFARAGKEAAQALSRLTGRVALGAVNGLSGVVTGLGQSFTGMAGAANSAITGIGAAITSGFSFSISGIGNAVAGVVSTIGNAISSVATIVGDLAASAAKVFGGLVSAATSLLPQIGGVLATAVSGVTNLISASVQAAASAVAGIVSVVTTAISTAIRTVASLVETAAAALGRMLQAVADTALKVGGIVAAAGAAMGSAIYKAVYAASDLAETVQKVGVVFGESTSVVTKAAAEMAKSLGIPKREFLDAASSIGLIAKAAGLAQGASANLSVKLAKLGADAASFYNMPLEDALGAMRSGLVGEAEPLRRFGVLLNEDAVKAEALSLGIVRNTKAMTDGQKVQARASLIIKGMTDASGDLARTQDSLANRTRELGGRFQTLMETIGKAFLPAAEAIAGGLSKLTGQITEWVETNLAQFSGFADYLESFGIAIGNIFSKWEEYKDLAGSVFADIAANARTVFDAIPGLIASAVKGAIPLLKTFAGMFKGLSDYVIHLFSEVAKTLSDHLKNAVFDAVLSLPSLMDNIPGVGQMKLAAAMGKVIPHKPQLKPIEEFVKPDEIADSATKFGDALKVALEGAVANFGILFSKLGFSQKTKNLAKAVTTPEKTKPEAKDTRTAVDRLNEQNKEKRIENDFKGTEAQAERILKFREQKTARHEAKERRENARKVARGQRVEANRLARLTPKERAAEAEAKEENRIASEKEQKKPGFVGPPALDGIAKPGAGATLQAKREAFKSEFIGLEDFAKKIQTNILSGGEDDAKKTARNTERTAKAVETLAAKAGTAPMAVAG